ncbi:MAG: FAD-dependent oxidoreductase [Lewinellaceae bacterium]|nr:FAD-dependent oxidoreductase [Lewinellaceae bacterium]
MATHYKILIIGGGIFGVTAAVELNRRGHEVHLFDQGALPFPRASSTDITKMVRADYGADEFYTDLMLDAFRGWDEWNREWPRPFYHQTGFLLLAHRPLEDGSLELESLKVLRRKGMEVERMGPAKLRQRFPQWNAERYADGYYNPRGGWAESGNVVARLVEIARKEGVKLHEGKILKQFLENGNAVKGIFTTDGEVHNGDYVILASGAWTPAFLPELQDRMRASGHPVYMFQPRDPSPFRGEVFPGWSSDISKTGWYGFPAQADGIVKVANHGKGLTVDPTDEYDVPEAFYPKLQEFLTDHLPGLIDAPITGTRVCFYCDTWDGDFYICQHPDRPGLVVAAGGSGHGFKFAPVLGGIIADVTEGKENPYAHRFRCREKGVERVEAARSRKKI